MRIAVPVNENKNETEICPSFGRAPFFVIYDTVYQEHDYMPNLAADAQGGAGIQAAQFLVNQKIDAVLTPRMGKNASEVILAAGIKIYQTKGEMLSENLKAYENSELSFLNDFHPGFHGNKG